VPEDYLTEEVVSVDRLQSVLHSFDLDCGWPTELRFSTWKSHEGEVAGGEMSPWDLCGRARACAAGLERSPRDLVRTEDAQ
jgi:hypothetical protein